jgi:hypothetical protein
VKHVQHPLKVVVSSPGGVIRSPSISVSLQRIRPAFNKCEAISVLARRKGGEMTATAAREVLGMKRMTFYSLVKRWETSKNRVGRIWNQANPSVTDFYINNAT